MRKDYFEQLKRITEPLGLWPEAKAWWKIFREQGDSEWQAYMAVLDEFGIEEDK